LLSYERPRFIIRVRASGGTYLRSLVRDIGAALGSGAYTASLRRIAIGNIQVDNAIAPQTVDAQAIRSFRDLFPSATVVTVRDAATRTLLKNGNTHLAAPHSDGRFWYCGENGALLAVVDFTRGEAHYVFVDPDASS
jgi:tRNA U55 pseudouridine synthase TruB